uniref:malectin isoform X2 n=1 Tax=Myxine glutinosa TaxID=7769 RepID=UPI00358E435F
MAFCFLLLLLLFPGSWADSLAERTVWAINAGGDTHTDQYGIQYSSDPLDGITGTASDYGLQMSIGRVPDEDQILYQTERWADTTFMYELDILGDGHYVIVLKFAEVYFSHPQQKVFDVRVNGHTVLKDLDIYQEVGRATALDVVVPLSVSRGRLSLSVGASSFHGSLSIEFVKGHHDNPKVCAIAVIRGIVDEPPLNMCSNRRRKACPPVIKGEPEGRATNQGRGEHPDGHVQKAGGLIAGGAIKGAHAGSK